MTRLKFSSYLFLVLGWLLCSCGRDPQLGGVGEDKGWLSTEKTREVAMHVLLNRYPQAQLLSELGEGQMWTYDFATNGVTLPIKVVVDRKAGKARFEKTK